MPFKARRNTTCVFEVVMAALMVDLGLRLILAPGMLDQSNMRLIVSVLSNYGLASALLLVGTARVCVMVRDEWFGKYALHSRIVLACLACMIWGSMVIAFLEHFISIGRALPPGFDMLTAQMVGELLVMYNLAREA
jgi:hypothetical protein